MMCYAEEACLTLDNNSNEHYVGFEVFTAVVMKSIIWDMTPRKPPACSIVLLNYSSTLKMEAIRSSETSGATQRTTRRHIPEDDTLQQ
jgi:hypothetical protein